MVHGGKEGFACRDAAVMGTFNLALPMIMTGHGRGKRGGSLGARENPTATGQRLEESPAASLVKESKNST